MCVYYQSKKKISEQPCSNGEPIRHTVMWEEIRTTHKLPGSPMGHVPMGTTDAEHCVERIQCTGSPPPPSRHHRDRTRTLVSWVPRHIVTPLPSQTPNENYMVSGRVERRETPGKSGISRPTRICLGEVGVVSVSLKGTSSDLNHVSKKGHQQEE
jgi:hypothetical protein